MKYIFLTTLLLFLGSCTKVDSSPETKDVIYNDLTAELEIATKAAEAEEKSLDSLKKEMTKAIPQTGQIKFALKKVQNAEASFAELTQRKIYFDIKKERRKAYVQFKYQESLKPGGAPWPDVKEIESYRAMEKFNRDKLDWDKNKGMKKDVPRGTKVEPKGHGEPAEGSEH